MLSGLLYRLSYQDWQALEKAGPTRARRKLVDEHRSRKGFPAHFHHDQACLEARRGLTLGVQAAFYVHNYLHEHF
jgi:hypothetical protein